MHFGQPIRLHRSVKEGFSFLLEALLGQHFFQWLTKLCPQDRQILGLLPNRLRIEADYSQRQGAGGGTGYQLRQGHPISGAFHPAHVRGQQAAVSQA